MIAVNEEGVAALKKMSSNVSEGTEGIKSACDSVDSEVGGLNNIGPHKTSIKNVVDSIRESVEGATAPANTVAEKLEAKAGQYERFIQNDRFKTSR